MAGLIGDLRFLFPGHFGTVQTLILIFGTNSRMLAERSLLRAGHEQPHDFVTDVVVLGVREKVLVVSCTDDGFSVVDLPRSSVQ